MSGPKDDLFHAKRGVAALAACVVQTLNESDPTFQERFVKRLEKAYDHFRYQEGDTNHELELLSWTRELLTGFNFSTGQGKPFLED
jgi:hypothetical protein